MKARQDTADFRANREDHAFYTHPLGLVLSTCVELHFARQLNDALWHAQPLESFDTKQRFTREQLDAKAAELQQQQEYLGIDAIDLGIRLAYQDHDVAREM